MGKGRDDALDLGQWFILRMAASDTLKLHDHLSRRGFRVWTPIDRKFGRRPRSRREYDKTFPLLPTYVFADASRLDDILLLANVEYPDHPRFRIMQADGGIPLISDIALEALQFEEDRRHAIYTKLKIRNTKAPVIPVDTDVRFGEGPFAGLPGVVVGREGSYTLVDFDAFPQPIKVSSLLLVQNVAMEETSPQIVGKAA